jgi:ABC-2 type transport system ATP-binding protein
MVFSILMTVAADQTRCGSVSRDDGRVPAAVEITELSVSYGPTVVLDRVELSVPAGTAVSLVGPNGAGKSTLLRCIAGLQAPTGGSVRVFGETPGQGLEFWRHVATTVESPSWYHGLTVREHLELVRVANGGRADDPEIDRLCAAFGLAGLDGSLPRTLSSGQRQRFLLTAAMVRPSRLLLVDEPEQRLDVDIKKTVAACLAEYVAGGGTLLMASHDADFVASTGAATFPVGESGA